MELKALKALTAAALLATASAATAGTAPFSIVSGAVSGVDVSLTVQESAVAGHDYDFVVSNNSLQGIVTGVFFESAWNNLLSNAVTSTGPATLVAGTSAPPIAGWDGTHVSQTVDQTRTRVRVGRAFRDVFSDNLAAGIQAGSSQTFSFSSIGDTSLGDIESLLGTDGFGVAIRLQGLPGDAQAETWGLVEQIEQEAAGPEALASFDQEGEGDGDHGVDVVSAPSPTAALAGLVVAGIAGLRRRRK